MGLYALISKTGKSVVMLKPIFRVNVFIFPDTSFSAAITGPLLRQTGGWTRGLESDNWRMSGQAGISAGSCFLQSRGYMPLLDGRLLNDRFDTIMADASSTTLRGYCHARCGTECNLQ